MHDFLQIAPADNVAVALKALSAGTVIPLEGASLTLAQDIPGGHKFALTPIACGENVIKYGFPIGHATAEILPGQHVHTHNLATNLKDELEYTWSPLPVPEAASPAKRFFSGYLRRDGRAGIRNDLWILPTVGCVNDLCRRLEREAQPLLGGSVEHICAFPHPYGCSQMGDDQENTRQILANLATHPNAGGVLVLGLGCENSGIDQLRPLMGDYDPERVRFLVCQQAEDEIAEAMKLLRELSARMQQDKRVPVSAEKLVIGLKCGGSDGYSGITANPVIGGFSDRLCALGGSTILTEVPEMFGAETLLMARCPNRELFDKTVHLINDFKAYYKQNHQTIYENPSPGNKAGGISTLEDKALGCTQKSGFSAVRDVLPYGAQVRTTGLNLLSAPGNDLVAATAEAAAGAQLVLFSTGRGTPFACPVPTLKIATNPTLAAKKKNWIDFNAGRLLEGSSLAALSDELLELVLAIAGGQEVCSEANGYHDLAIFKTGVTL